MSDEFAGYGGSVTADVLNFKPDAIPEPDTLFIFMTRGERQIADRLSKRFCGLRRVIIDVDGERHEFSVDSIIRLLEGYEGARDTSRYAELFGTPERAALTWYEFGGARLHCEVCPICDDDRGITCALPEGLCAWCEGGHDALLEWLRGEGGDGNGDDDRN